MRLDILICQTFKEKEYELLDGIFTALDSSGHKIRIFKDETFDYEGMTKEYGNLLKAEGCPDIIISMGNPIANYVAKRSLLSLDLTTPVTLISMLLLGVEQYGDGEKIQGLLNLADMHFAMSDYIIESIWKIGGVKPVFKINIPENFADFERKLLEAAFNRDKILSSKGSRNILYEGDKISVVLPCYNVEKYLHKCLDSMLNQTLDADMYEIICVNDASTDGTLGILKEYEEKYPDQILLVDCKKNTGLGSVRNIATYNYLNGNYIVYIDSDDYITPEYLKTLYEEISIYDTEISTCSFFRFNENAIFESSSAFSNEYFDMSNIDRKKMFLVKYLSTNSAWAKIFRRDYVIHNNLKFSEGITMEDVFFYQLGVMYSSSISTLSKKMYAYRINENGITMDKEKKYIRQLDIHKVTVQSLKALLQNGLLEGFEEEYQVSYLEKCFLSLLPEGTIESVDREREEYLRGVKQETLLYFPDFFENKYINSDQSEYAKKTINYFRNL